MRIVRQPATALVDVEQLNKALTALGNMNLTGPITYVMIDNVIQGVRAALIEEPVIEEHAKEEKCQPSDTPQNNSSEKSETEQ